ncbi:MAG: Inositol-1-monophosphatase, partial [uncultured Gemmatimonadaceae bacterium]
LAAARGAAEQAAAVLRDHAGRRASLAWEAKSRTDFVSVADRAAEDVVREALLHAVPDAVVLGEEGSPDAAAGRGTVFVVDPLDGTTNFLHGYPWFGVSIAALVDGTPVAGVVRNVATGELFTATLGGGAFREAPGGAREPIAVSTESDPARALLGTGLPFKHAHHVAPYLRSLPRILGAVAGVRRAGAAVLDLCDVACGRFEAFWELELAPWDMAAGLVIAREAGALVTDLRGRPAPVAAGPIVAGNPAMHAWLLEQLVETAELLEG